MEDDFYAGYYDEEDATYYQEEGYYDEGAGDDEAGMKPVGDEEEYHEQMEAVDLIKEERAKIISEYERLEMQAFESEFNSLIQESTQSVRKEI